MPCFRVLFQRFSSQIIITNSKANFGISDFGGDIYTKLQLPDENSGTNKVHELQVSK